MWSQLVDGLFWLNPLTAQYTYLAACGSSFPAIVSDPQYERCAEFVSHLGENRNMSVSVTDTRAHFHPATCLSFVSFLLLPVVDQPLVSVLMTSV